MTFLVVFEDLNNVNINNINLKHVITAVDETELELFYHQKRDNKTWILVMFFFYARGQLY